MPKAPKKVRLKRPTSRKVGVDFRFFTMEIPTGIEFTIEHVKDKEYRLRGPGYGEKGDYGNGAIHVWGKPGKPNMQAARTAYAVAESIREWLEVQAPEAYTWDGFNEAILGLGYRSSKLPVVIYDYDKMIEIHMENTECTWESAGERSRISSVQRTRRLDRREHSDCFGTT